MCAFLPTKQRFPGFPGRRRNLGLTRQQGSSATCRGPGRYFPPLLDHLVGSGEDRWRHGEAEGLGSLEIDDQLECRRLLDRQIGWPLALEDPSGVNADLAKDSDVVNSDVVNSIADQAAGRRKIFPHIARGNGMA